MSRAINVLANKTNKRFKKIGNVVKSEYKENKKFYNRELIQGIKSIITDIPGGDALLRTTSLYGRRAKAAKKNLQEKKQDFNNGTLKRTKGAIMCRKEYERIMRNPGLVIPVCLPKASIGSSWTDSWAKTVSFTTGTAQAGYCVMAPCLSGNSFCITKTGPTYEGSGEFYTYNNGSITGTTSDYNGGLLTENTLVGENNVGRIVAMSLKVMNTTPNLYQQGMVYIGETPNHTSLEGITDTNIQTSNQNIKVPIQGLGSVDIFFMPNDSGPTGLRLSAECDYTELVNVSDLFPWSDGGASSTSGSDGSPSLYVVAIGANATNPATFTCIWTTYAEYSGTTFLSRAKPVTANTNDYNDLLSLHRANQAILYAQ